jgi:ABC-2 type transport system ATP-binding protein
MDNMIIEFIGVNKIFGNHTALDNLSFSVRSNEFVALVGNNGSGKTTTVKTLCNLIPYDSGSIRIFNKKITPPYVSYRSMIGVFLSEPMLINEFTPREYLKFICKFQGVNNMDAERRIKELFEFFSINSYDKKKIIEYSSGDKIKISIAAALIHNPDLLIFDEPFIHLDIKSLDLILTLLHSFKGKKALFITSHNLDLIHNLCKRILIIEKGKIIDDITNSPQESFQSLKDVIKGKLGINNSVTTTPEWLV